MKAFTTDTCVKAWIAVSKHLMNLSTWRDYNIVLEIRNPMSLPAEDRAIYDLVDGFLHTKASKSLSTIVNTIFPATLYCNYGREGVFKRFPEMWETIEKHPDIEWGTYFRRMTNRKVVGKSDINPLERLIEKLKGQMNALNFKHATYELGIHEPDEDLATYDPRTDARRIMGGPCLSHLSFKLKDDRSLMLTAFYRSHYYIHRALGNFVGLAWLQHFVAAEIGARTSELVCISSMATLDIKGWRKSDVIALLGKCEKCISSNDLSDQSPQSAIHV